MAFPSAPGYGNLPNGAFSPVIYSKKAQMAFRKSSICQAVTNSEYFGEISGFGDSVKIIKEPEINVFPYARGQAMVSQDLVDEDFTLVVDKANAFQFKLDDIEEMHSHINFMSMATDRAGYRLKDQFDQEILGYMTGFKQSAIHGAANTARVAGDIPGTKAIPTAGDDELLAVNKLRKDSFTTISGGGDHSIPVAPRLPGMTTLPTAYVSPATIIARMARLLDQQNVESNNRWLVIDPALVEVLKDEDSRFLNADFGEAGALRNGLILSNVHGFRVYVSNNLPKIGNGPEANGTTNQNTDYGVIVAGHDSAVATAEQVTKTETIRDPNTFADIVRGLHVYGRKILRPEAIVTAKWNLA
jgi:hypothetical protein